MKNEKTATSKLKDNANISGNNSAGNNSKKSGATDTNLTTNPVKRTKASAGRGLANEGTIVSYDEER